MFDNQKSAFVKVAATLISGGFAVSGAVGLGTASIGGARLCAGDFILVCHPLETPLPILLSVVFVSAEIFLFHARTQVRKQVDVGHRLQARS